MIRRANAGDAPALARIMGEDDVGHWETLLADEGRFTAVIDGDDGVPIGLVSARPGHLSYLFVEPQAQNSGVGSALHDAALEWMGCSAATLRVAVGNERARRFYEKRGWELSGEPEFDPWLERHMVPYYTSFSIGTSTRLPHSVHDPS